MDTSTSTQLFREVVPRHEVEAIFSAHLLGHCTGTNQSSRVSGIGRRAVYTALKGVGAAAAPGINHNPHQ